jgi:DNA-directed RNA polymerase specialized sigma24 family protein
MRLLGGTEETTSGRMRLEPLRGRLRRPVLVINDSPIKQFAENEHAVGQSALESFPLPDAARDCPLGSCWWSGGRPLIFVSGWRRARCGSRIPRRTIMRTMKTGSGLEALPGMTTCRPGGSRGRIPAARTEGDAGQAARAEQDAGLAVTALYQMHYRSLVRLAALLVSDLATAEDIVQDSFAAMHGMWPALSDADAALPDTGAALCYLRRLVVRRSRSAPRIQLGGGTHAPGLPDSAVVTALQALPVRQREVLVLQYFADLPMAEIASATGMSTAAVRSHGARAMSSLRAELHPAAE